MERDTLFMYQNARYINMFFSLKRSIDLEQSQPSCWEAFIE